MKVLHIINNLVIGGTEKFILDTPLNPSVGTEVPFFYKTNNAFEKGVVSNKAMLRSLEINITF